MDSKDYLKILVACLMWMCILMGADMIYTQRKMIVQNAQKTQDIQDRWYQEQIEKWVVPYVIPEVKKPKTGWENRFNG